jgi:uncharacterized membrane protein YedE/YeeE
MIVRLLSASFIGALFGLGIAISGMANPAKVLNFFDIAGTWDPSLIFVMGGALITTAIGYRLVFRTYDTPEFDPAFHLPGAKDIDARLAGGSALFGVGWGIAGFCPGGAVPALGLMRAEALIFVCAMIAGIIIARAITARQNTLSRA